MSGPTTEYRIWGPPGCGKTTTLSRLITEACQEYGSEAVIVSSFTRAAAKELVGRNLPLNEDQVGTLHALCYRALDRPKLVSKSLLAEWNAEHPMLAFGGVQTNLDDPYGDFERSGSQIGDELLQEYNRFRALHDRDRYCPARVEHFATQWTDFKANTGTVDFTDLIEQCLHGEVPIPHEASVLFLDEVQDFSPLELALGRRWGQSCERLYLAGDDDQSIYAFKGCTPDAFLHPDVPPEQVTILSQSYRVPRAVHEAACRWVEKLSVRQPKAYRPRDAEGVVGQLACNYKYLTPLRERLLDWLDHGKTVMLLASCSYMLDPLKRQLREWGLPFWNPYRKTRGDWNPLQSRAGTVGAGERVHAYRKVSSGQGWWTYRELWQWCAPLKAESVFARGAKTAMRHKAEDVAVADTPVAEADIDAWMPDEETTERAGQGDLAWLRAQLLDPFAKPIDYACRVWEERGPEALAKSPQITIGTIHSVKGAESQIVVLCPDLSYSGLVEWSRPGERQDAIRRLFYVGMTRAKEELYWMQPAGHAIWGYL